GWLFVTPPGGSLSLSVSGNVQGILFGLFRGSVVEGRVFWDDGLGGGSANDALQNGGEAGVGGVEVRATNGANTRTAPSRNGAGFYRIYLPASWGNITSPTLCARPRARKQAARRRRYPPGPKP
ncbi:MAG: hypothetical protein ABDH20_01180, partial [Thermus sp.]